MAEKSVKSVVEELLERVNKLENDESGGENSFFKYFIRVGNTQLNFSSSSSSIQTISSYFSLDFLKENFVSFSNRIKTPNSNTWYGTCLVENSTGFMDFCIWVNSSNSSVSITGDDAVDVLDSLLVLNKELTDEEIENFEKNVYYEFILIKVED